VSVSNRLFLRDVYDEHVEECAFLYEFVVGARGDQEFPWTAAHDFERRREAHVDALLVGADAALARCEHALEDGPGAVYACTAVIARSSDPSSLYWRLASLEPRRLGVEASDVDGTNELEAVLAALRDALVEHASDEVLARLAGADAASHEASALALFGVALAVERRALPGDHRELHRMIGARVDATAPLGLVGAPGLRDHHLVGLLSPSASLRHACIEHLFRAGGAPELERLRSLAHSGAGNYAALVSGGGTGLAKTLHAAARSALDDDLLLALGLLGTPDCVALIFPALESEHAEAASIALHAITGAVLVEEVFEAEAIDASELFEDELEAWQDGIRPTRVDGQPWGQNRTVLTTDPVRWRAWLDSHAGAFSKGTRYRQGRAMSAETLLFTLRREHTPHVLRRYSAMELRVRHAIGHAFDVTLSVAEQIHRLGQLRATVSGHDTRG